MRPETDMDYVELFALKLLEEPALFQQQKKLIESQLKSSRMIFRQKFGAGEKFKDKAREYLKGIELI